MAISATLDEASEAVTLRHPNRPDLTVQPDTDSARLIHWVRPLVDADRAQPTQVYRLDGRSFTDTPYPSISLCNHASLGALEQLTGTPVQPERWRANIWFEGATAWDEFDWVGRQMRIGTVRLKVEDRIRRCLATTVNTDTGVRDVDTLKALNMLDHQDFGIYASIIETGEVACGDQLELV